MKKKNRNGFTLIELVMVMVILGVLAVVAVPRYNDLTTKAKIEVTHGSLGAVRAALVGVYSTRAVAGNASFPTSLVAADFVGNRLPVNKLTDKDQVVTVGSSPGGTTTHATAGFWYITSSDIAGAYSDGTIDTAGW